MSSLKGEPADLCQYAGKVVLVVNTASYCGYTGQYEGLEALYQRFRERGLRGPGRAFQRLRGARSRAPTPQVADFCERTYKVRFPMLAKSVVSGPQAAPLYRGLAASTGQAPRWNFHKYLLGRDGQAARELPERRGPRGCPPGGGGGKGARGPLRRARAGRPPPPHSLQAERKRRTIALI